MRHCLQSLLLIYFIDWKGEMKVNLLNLINLLSCTEFLNDNIDRQLLNSQLHNYFENTKGCT